MKISLPLLLLFMLLNSLNAQLSLEIIHSEGKGNVMSARSGIEAFNYKKEFKDSLEIAQYLKDLITAFHSDAFLSASADSIIYTDKKVTVWLHSGIRYRWVNTSFELVDRQALREIRIRPGRFEKAAVSFEDFRLLQKRLLGYYENSGYPFATVSLQEPEIMGDTIAGILTVEKNQYYSIDNIYITGDTLVEQKILYRHIGIQPGDQYSEKKFKNAGERIGNTPGLNEIRKAEMEFFSETAGMYLYLSKRQASHFSGILGITPGESRQKSRLAGEVDVNLVNVMRRMENISLRWHSPGNNIQQLDVKAGQPYLFGRGFGIELQLHMFRQDSTYMKVEGEAGIPFSLGENGVIRAYIKTTGTSLISGRQVAAFSAPAAGVKGRSYGLSWLQQKIDNRINPYRGWAVEASLGAGNKTVTPPSWFGSETYLEKTGFTEGIARLQWYIPVTASSTLLLENQSGFKRNFQNENAAAYFFANELYLLGGLQSIRGFDYRSIAASSYSLQKIEYRYLFDDASNVFLFFDGMVYNQKLPDSDNSDKPFGVGGGLTIDTRAGQFTVSYALGKQLGNPLSFRSARVHMGIINRF